MTNPTPIIAPGTLPGRARAPSNAHNRRARLATNTRATGPARPCPTRDGEPRRNPGLEEKPSNISLTPQSTRLDLPPVPPRQRPDTAQQHIHRQRGLTKHPPYQCWKSILGEGSVISRSLPLSAWECLLRRRDASSTGAVRVGWPACRLPCSWRTGGLCRSRRGDLSRNESGATGRSCHQRVARTRGE